EVSLNQALFEKEGVEVIGVVLNKVTADKIDYISDFARRGLKRKGLELLGVIPHQPILSRPTLNLIQEELNAESLNDCLTSNALVSEVVVGAMGVHNAIPYFKKGVLLITPGDREDILLAAATTLSNPDGRSMAGIVLTGNLRPGESILRVIREMPYPVLLARDDSYKVASKVHDLIVKTRPDDTLKIELIRDMIAKHVDIKRILNSL
ncbi:MAG TPA: DRTGG domain-containing protein, partial [Roseimicrobium sp.]|nr:DRTGG domain-containing protein [Roseimicrobium sp.]